MVLQKQICQLTHVILDVGLTINQHLEILHTFIALSEPGHLQAEDVLVCIRAILSAC